MEDAAAKRPEVILLPSSWPERAHPYLTAFEKLALASASFLGRFHLKPTHKQMPLEDEDLEGASVQIGFVEPLGRGLRTYLPHGQPGGPAPPRLLFAVGRLTQESLAALAPGGVHGLPRSPAAFAEGLVRSLLDWDGRSTIRLDPGVFPQAVPGKTAPRSGKRLLRPEGWRLGKPPASEDGGPAASTDIHGAAASDQPTERDTLGFSPYVRALADFLESDSTRPPLTVSIEGEWGSGKSSFLLQLRKELGGPEGGARIVTFNPWRHDAGDSLWAAFALHFIAAVRGRTLRERALGRLRLLWLRWRGGDASIPPPREGRVWAFLAGATLGVLGAAAGLGVAAWWLSQGLGATAQAALTGLAAAAPATAASAWALLDPVQRRLRHHLRDPDYESRITFVERFHEEFRRIVTAYADGRKVFVFLEDLDRCEAPQAAELMQALNLLIADDAPLFFILALDRQKVAASIAFRHRDILPYLSGAPDGGAGPRRAGVEYGYAFLEKFIQVPFVLPRPTDRQIEAFLLGLSGPPASSPMQDPGRLGAKPSRAQPQAQDGAQPPANLPPAPDPVPAVRAAEADSPLLREVAVLVAPAFDNNPRRLKQFLNVFRLRALLAQQTGLFRSPAGRPREALTLEQLGKFVALSLRFPMLVEDLESDPLLLPRLDAAARSPAKAKGAAGDWLARAPALRGLLLAGTQRPDGWRYAMGGLDVARLLRVSPRVTQRPAPKPTGGATRMREQERLRLYQDQARLVWEGSIPSGKEKALLRDLRRRLSIAPEEADRIEADVRKAEGSRGDGAGGPGEQQALA